MPAATHLPLVALALLRAVQAPDGGVQDPPAEQRAAALRAMVVLKIAPYLTPEQRGKEQPRTSYRIAIVGRDPVATAAIQLLPGKQVDKATVSVVGIGLDEATGDPSPDHERPVSRADEARVDAGERAQPAPKPRAEPVQRIVNRPPEPDGKPPQRGKDGEPVPARDPAPTSGPPELPPYDLLYIAASVDDASVARILAHHADVSVPIVCERPGFARRGGGVQLFVQDNHVRFEINANALKKQGVRASPQLLKLSREAPR